jgi:hypothetical protein
MQSTLILGLRGPDTHACPNVKHIQRWLRGLVFRPGNPANVREFMAVELPLRIMEKGPTAKELEFCSQHFYSHLMHSLQVVGMADILLGYPRGTRLIYPTGQVCDYAMELYGDMCRLMHLDIEDMDKFEHRLKDLDWPGGKQPENAAEATALLDAVEGAKR